ncbi:MAG: MBOAT family O-acyltransferase [Thermodesulfobacteriota bacterium]
MAFDHPSFLVFLPVALLLYHLAAASHRVQNAIVAASGLVFYGWFGWRLCLLLVAYAVVGYAGGRFIAALPEDAPARRRALRLVVGVLVLGLAVFKYFDFFQHGARAALATIGLAPGWPLVEVLMPLGLSFYCFQSIAYVVDVHRRVIEAERDPVTFAAFMFFFPQLVAGPIARAPLVLRQFQRPRTLVRDDVGAAVWLLLLGFFSKVVAADTIGGYVDVAFQPSAHTTGWVVLLGAIGFALQVYFDFNGYSLIAKGAARLFGIELAWNFDRPYWSTSVQEFWRRWHITLSNWLRDYLYLPLGGGSRGESRATLSLISTMAIAGAWHGVGWTFLVWGTAHGVALAVHRSFRVHFPRVRVPAAAGWLMTMAFVVPTFFVFRAPSLAVAAELVRHCDRWAWRPFDTAAWLAVLATSVPVFLIEAWQSRRRDLLAPARLAFVPFSLLAAALIVAIFARFWGTEHSFIYSQF